MGLDICFEKEYVLNDDEEWIPTIFHGSLPHFHCSYGTFNSFRFYLQWLASEATHYEVKFHDLLSIYYFPGTCRGDRDQELKEFRDHEKDFPGLYALWCHSDCDGVLTGEQQSLIAKDLEKLLEVEGFVEHTDEEIEKMGEEERDKYEDAEWMHALMKNLLEMCKFGENLVFG